jgi:hypothetical protein
MIHFLRLK